jgi:hypothetical protein
MSSRLYLFLESHDFKSLDPGSFIQQTATKYILHGWCCGRIWGYRRWIKHISSTQRFSYLMEMTDEPPKLLSQSQWKVWKYSRSPTKRQSIHPGGQEGFQEDVGLLPPWVHIYNPFIFLFIQGLYLLLPSFLGISLTHPVGVLCFRKKI